MTTRRVLDVDYSPHSPSTFGANSIAAFDGILDWTENKENLLQAPLKDASVIPVRSILAIF